MRFAPQDVPWQRVVGVGGALPIIKRSPELHQQQRSLLLEERVVFLPGDAARVDMAKCQWLPAEVLAGAPPSEGLFAKSDLS
jgi:alkylated DNA nucleotide flippase Atl1